MYLLGSERPKPLFWFRYDIEKISILGSQASKYIQQKKSPILVNL